MKKIIFLCLWAVTALAQTQPFSNLREAMAAGGRMNGRSGPASVNWISNGQAFSFIDKPGSIVKFDPQTKQTESIFTAAGKTFPDTQEPFTYESFQWSADGQFLLFQTRFKPVWRYSGDADYFLYQLSTGKLTKVAEGARTAELSPDGKKVAFEKGGNLFVLDLADQKVQQLTQDATPTRYNGRFGWAYEEEFGLVQAWVWSPDSRYIAFWHSDETQVPMYQMSDFQGMHPEFQKIPYPRVGDPNIQVKIGMIDLQPQPITQWAQFDLLDGYVPRMYWTSTPGQLAIQHLNRAQNHLTLYFSQANSGKTSRILEEKDDQGWVDVFDFFANTNDLMLFPTNRKEFFWVSGRTGRQHIDVYSYEGKLLRTLTQGDWDVTSLQAFDSKNNRILYSSTEVSPLERHVFSVSLDGKTKQRLTPESGVHRVHVAPQGTFFIDAFSSLQHPRKVVLRQGQGQIVHTFEENQAVSEYIGKIPFAARSLQKSTTRDGQMLDIYLVKPHNFDPSKKYPLVLTIYGGPGSQSVYNEWAGNAWEQWLAQQGYVVASVNNRGSGGYGQRFMQKVYQNLGYWESQDFVDVAQNLAKENAWVDGSRMAIQGHSYGGFMSSYTLLNHPGVFKVGLVGAPVTDWRLYDNIYTERYMGLLAENAAGYQKTVLAKSAKNLQDKMLLAHSMMDDNVHVTNTFQLVKGLTDAGKDIDLRIYPPGNHGVAYNMESRILLYQTYFDYLERHLKP